MVRLLLAVVTALALTAFGPAIASAQEARVAELQARLSPGDTVRLDTANGLSIEGTLRTVSATLLTIERDKTVVTLRTEDVQRVTRRHHPHGVRNGALLGAALGAVAGGVWAATADDCTFTCFSSAGGILAFASIGGAVGLGIGAAAGASLRSDEVLFDGADGRIDGSPARLSQPVAAALIVQVRW